MSLELDREPYLCVPASVTNNYTLFLQLKSTLRGLNIPVLEAKTLGKDEFSLDIAEKGQSSSRPLFGELVPFPLELVRKALYFRSQKTLKQQLKLTGASVSHSSED